MEGEEEKAPAGPAPPVEPTIREKALFYTTAFFILLAVFSLFAFLFLVPFVIDPAFSTIFKEFDPEPTLCYTQEVINLIGSSNCTWTSCREGCTKEIFNCTQILVKYRIGGSPTTTAVTDNSPTTRSHHHYAGGPRSRRAISRSNSHSESTIDEETSGVRWNTSTKLNNINSRLSSTYKQQMQIPFYQTNNQPQFSNSVNNVYSVHDSSYYANNNNYQRTVPSSSSLSSKGEGSTLTTDDRNIHKKKKHKTLSSSLVSSSLSSPHIASLQSSYYSNSRVLRPGSSSSSSSASNLNSESESSGGGAGAGSSGGWFHRAHLFPNVRGCGYPPKVNCSRFLSKYAHVGRNFSCYYSKVDPKLVVTTFNMNRLLFELVLSMAIPIPCFVISTIYIVFAYFKIYAPSPTAPRTPHSVTAAASTADVNAIDANTSSSCQTANNAASAAAVNNSTTNLLTTDPILITSSTNNNIASIPRLLPGDGEGQGSSDDLDASVSTTDEKAQIIQQIGRASCRERV